MKSPNPKPKRVKKVKAWMVVNVYNEPDIREYLVYPIYKSFKLAKKNNKDSLIQRIIPITITYTI